MRRKNRQIKMTIDIPEEYATDEAFMQDLQEGLYAVEWVLLTVDEAGGEGTVPINRIALGDIEIEPEE